MTKGPLLQTIYENLPESRKQRIQDRANKLEAEYRTLHDLRQQAGLTQAAVSKAMKMPQSNVSRLERNSDMLISTLRIYVEAMGGKLNLTVELPNKPPVILSGLGDLITD
ncbi:MAG: XRE family transcriptional regulator [Gammaproteobacteria bacterium]|nr:XRE family transcriptional regulator [Gammaproteobacteria bacterium]